MNFEVVLENRDEAALAARYGATRIELCGALEVGGITPSAGIIEACANLGPELHVMIRPRPGGFTYNASEIKVMERDVEIAATYGARGVVFGLLTDRNEVEVNATEALVRQARSHGLEVTFHRAIDFVKDQRRSIESLIDIGVNRILTSGGANDVDAGWQDIIGLFEQARGRIQIMAGGGVNLHNAALLKNRIDALHFNVRKATSGNLARSMGTEYELDEDKIAAISQLLTS